MDQTGTINSDALENRLGGSLGNMLSEIRTDLTDLTLVIESINLRRSLTFVSIPAS